MHKTLNENLSQYIKDYSLKLENYEKTIYVILIKIRN